MGIKCLYEVINKHCPGAVTKIKLSELSGCRVAIDISVFLYKYIRTSSHDWIRMFFRLLCSLRKYRIRAICIFDGKKMPIEKQNEREKRQAQTEKYEDQLVRCNAIRTELKSALLKGDLVVPANYSKECASLFRKKEEYKDTVELITVLDKKINKLYDYTEKIDDEKVKIAKKICTILGITHIQSEGEAETLCCYLQLKGHVDAVITEDTDVLAYGCTMMLAPKDLSITAGEIYKVSIAIILEKLDMTMADFRDLCICLRCDYNKNNGPIKGTLPGSNKVKNLGKIGMLTLFKTYGSFSKIIENNHMINPEELNMETCRTLLTVPKYMPIDIPNFIKPPNKKKILTFLQKNNCYIADLDTLLSYWNPPKFII